MLRTYSTDIRVSASQDEALQAYARVVGQAQRSLHAAVEAQVAAGAKPRPADFKVAFCQRFGLTARQFNAVRIGLEGQRDSIRTLTELGLFELARRIERVKRDLAEFTKRVAKASTTAYPKLERRRAQLHDQLQRLSAKHARRLARHKAGHISLCFGSKKLFKAQYLQPGEAGAYSSRAAWQQAWADARSSQFSCVGSKDETAGNQTCVATAGAADTLALRLRLPDAVAATTGEKHLHLVGVSWPYGGEDVLAGLSRGTALSYRFMRQGPGHWRIAITLEVLRDVAPATSPLLGRLGVDINAGFLLVTETDERGNKVLARRLNTPERSRTADQRDALRGNAVKALMAWAVRTGKPVVLEDLELGRKKAGRSAETNRKVSALAYSQLRQLIEARGADLGVAVEIVDPSYSSVQGRIKAVRHGLTVHGGAALVLARRGQGFAEPLPKSASHHRLAVRGGECAWLAPARMPAANTTAAWRTVARSIQQVIASHHRAQRAAAPPRELARARAAMVPGESPGLNFEI